MRSPEKKFYFCQKIVFCVYLPNYTHFGKNNNILRSPEKKLFFSKKSFFVFICQTIHISAKTTIIWDHLEKKYFSKKIVCCLSTFRQKQRYFEIALKKIIFSQKTVFCLYLAFNDIFRSPRKKLFFPKKSFFAFIL